MNFLKITRPYILAAMLALPTAAYAQQAPAEDDSSGIADIIVTAQKRSENLQSVPVAVTAFSGDTLAERGVVDMQSLSSLIPNMGFSNAYSQVRITLRGLSFADLAAQGGEARVAYHVDGAYMAMTGDIGGTFYDIERVEVNRGPQGTLFGRNATAGTVNVVTRNPTDTLSGYLNAEVGNYRAVNVDGAISGPLGDGVSARIAFQSRNHAGYEYNVPNQVDINNQSMQAVRAKLMFDKSNNFTAILSADYVNENDRSGPLLVGFAVPNGGAVFTGLGAQYQDAGPNPNPRHNYSGQLPLTDKESYGATLDLKLTLGEGLSIASLTNYRHSKFRFHDDMGTFNSGTTGSGSVVESRQFEKAEQFSEELRLSKDFSFGNVTLGGFLYSQDYDTGGDGTGVKGGNAVLTQFGSLLGSTIGFPPSGYRSTPNLYVQGFIQGAGVRTRGEAIFGEVTFNLTDSTKLIAGARYSWERRTLVNSTLGLDLVTLATDPTFVLPAALPDQKTSYRNFSPRVTLQQELGPDAMVYATFAKGFKTGGFNAAQYSSYKPEILTDYEVGFKADLLDRKLRLNGAGFYYDYQDLQTIVIPANQSVPGSVNTNSNAKVYGGELELTAVPTPNFELNAAVAVIHGEFTSAGITAGGFSVKGNKLPWMPSYTLSYGAQYTFPISNGGITLRVDGQTKGKTFFTEDNNPLVSQDAYTIVNASIGWHDADDRLSVTAFVRNIGDTLAVNGGFPLPGFLSGAIRGSYDPPRTWGIRAGVKF